MKRTVAGVVVVLAFVSVALVAQRSAPNAPRATADSGAPYFPERFDWQRIEREQHDRDVLAELLDAPGQLGAVHVGQLEAADDDVLMCAHGAANKSRRPPRRCDRPSRREAGSAAPRTTPACRFALSLPKGRAARSARGHRDRPRPIGASVTSRARRTATWCSGARRPAHRQSQRTTPA